MRLTVLGIFLYGLFFGLICNQNIQAFQVNRQRININREWKFTLGDYAGAEAESYDDREWSVINLPHNFSIPYFQSAHWSKTDESVKWWQVDLENLYTISGVNILFPAEEQTNSYRIEVSKDNQNWETVVDQKETSNQNRLLKHQFESKSTGRFLRILFSAPMNKAVCVREVEVFGKTSN